LKKELKGKVVLLISLSRIKDDDNLKHIPVVMLTTSSTDKDVNQSYLMGAAGYIRKPVDYKEISEIVKAIDQYWLSIVVLPK